MKESKLPIIIITVLVIILIAVVVFGVLFLGGKNGGNSTKNENSEDLISPVLDLSLNTDEADQEEVVIAVVATTEDEAGVDYILLPNGEQVFADKTEYTVTENGKYEFKAFGKNGAKSKLSIDVKNIKQISAKTPYLPEGFEHVEGEVDEGYVIKDKYENQYVWVPVETGILERTTRTDKNYEDSSASASGLVNSVAKNFGFYIARYESSAFQANGTKFAASLVGQKPWSNVTYREASDAAENTAKVLQYPDGFVTALCSSYAWDTTLAWIDSAVTNYSTNTSYGNYSGTILQTGATESDKARNIFDLAGNVREWTTEIYKDNGEENIETYEGEEEQENLDYLRRVVRGGSAYINKVANSRNGYSENLTDEYWGFRTVLYKNT